MKIHRLVTLGGEGGLNESRSTSFDLNSAASLLLDVLDIGALLADHLGSQVESTDWFKIDWDILLGPFALLVTVSDIAS